jgi:hypothetical protein
MNASSVHSDPTRPILLTTLGGAVVSVIVCAGAFRRLGAEPSAASGPPCDAVTAPSPAAASTSRELDVARTECESNPSTETLAAEANSPASSVIVPVGRAKEKDLRAAFVALERAEPGTLDARAASILASDGPTAEKVALLRALRDTASPATAHWLDVTVRSAPNAAGVPAQPLSNFALEQLTELAARDGDACAALGRLAFDSANVADDLRRRACAGYAATCPADSLSDLNGQLSREQDELVIASALSALESRSSEPGVQRVLAAYEHAQR